MVAFARAIIAAARSVTAADFVADVQLQDGVQYRLIVLGEAARRLSNDFRMRHPAIAWSDIIGLRDILVHACHRVDLQHLWNIVTRDVPARLACIERSSRARGIDLSTQHSDSRLLRPRAVTLDVDRDRQRRDVRRERLDEDVQGRRRATHRLGADAERVHRLE